MDVTLGSHADLDEFVELLEDVGDWLASRGIPQWPPGASRAQLEQMRSQVEAGVLLCLRGGDTNALAGGCVVCTEPYDVWAGRLGAGTYLHKLVVARSVAGRGWGARLVERAESWTLERGLSRLRLDCWDGNAMLRAYYRDLGFLELDVVAVSGYEVRLFEKSLRLGT